LKVSDKLVSVCAHTEYQIFLYEKIPAD